MKIDKLIDKYLVDEAQDFYKLSTKEKKDWVDNLSKQSVGVLRKRLANVRKQRKNIYNRVSKAGEIKDIHGTAYKNIDMKEKALQAAITKKGRKTD